MKRVRTLEKDPYRIYLYGLPAQEEKLELLQVIKKPPPAFADGGRELKLVGNGVKLPVYFKSSNVLALQSV